MPVTSTSPIKILTDLGYEMVDIESDTDYLSALMEAVNTLDASDYRIPLLQDEVKRIRAARKAENPSPAMKLKKTTISAAAFKKGSAIGGAEKAVPADTTGASALALRQPGGELLKDIEAPEQPASPLDGLLGIVREIAGGVDSIKQTLMDQQGLQKDASDDARNEKEQKKRGFKEKALELGGKAFAGIKKVGEKIIEPVKGIFSKIIEFLTGIILGRAVMKLFDWFTDPANKKKVGSLFKFLKDWWPVLVATIMAFVGPGVTFIAGVVALLAWSIPKIVNIVKQLFGWVPGINDALKDVDKDAKKVGVDIVSDVKNQSEEVSKDIPTEDTGESQSQVQPVQGSAEKTQKDLQNVQPAQGMAEGGPVESQEGGQVRGEKGDDKVPAMLTDGEFVLSKEAVQKYGVDALLSLNAAAGATNKPSVKEGVPAFKEGGPVGGSQPQKSEGLKEKEEDKGLFGGLFNFGKKDDKESTQEKVDTKHKKDHSNMKVVTPRGGHPGAPGMDGAFGVSGIDGASGQKGQRGSGVLNIASKAANMFAPHLGIGDAIKSGPAGMLRQIAGKLTSPHRAMMKGMGQNMMDNPMVQQMMQMPAVQGLMGQAKESFAGSPLSKVAEGMFGKDAVDGVMGSIGASGISGISGADGAGINGISGADGADGVGINGISGISGTPRIMGIASVDIKAGSPIMKTSKPPIGEGIKPLSPKPPTTMAYDGELAMAGMEALNQVGGGGGANTKDIPQIDAAKKISANKLAVLGIVI